MLMRPGYKLRQFGPLACVRLYLLPNANITHNFKKILIMANFSNMLTCVLSAAH